MQLSFSRLSSDSTLIQMKKIQTIQNLLDFS